MREQLMLTSAPNQARCTSGVLVLLCVQALNLFSWQEVETMVCGRPEVDIDLLEVH